ncbi:SDR family oxidoreductase [Tistrella bauzanensis]|uniref:SDR family oxidoreductase n=1 Tax=Tistrella TaxID=171436 RepID=UPI0031F7083A
MTTARLDGTRLAGTQLDGQVAWITGAGSGIGEAAALALAEAGATVYLSGRRADALDAVASRIRDAGGQALVALLDVADKAAVREVADAIVQAQGRIDILVNSAGLNVPNRSWETVDTDGWDQVIRVDLDGAFYCTHAVLPAMRKAGGGLVINVSSWAGRYDVRLTGPAYNAAKHAMLAMNASLNLEEGQHGIRACAICPGEVNTAILDRRPVPVTAEDRARMLQSEDLGATIRFVATMPPHVCLNEILISPTWNRLNIV